MMSIWKDETEEYEKREFPQPLPPFDHIKIVTFGYPFATWAGNACAMYENLGHIYDLQCKYQIDPGRFHWAWTVGKHTELRPCEEIILPNKHFQELAVRLERLNGMKFKALSDTQLDSSKLRLNSSATELLKRYTGNELGIVGGFPFVMVMNSEQQPASPAQISQQFQQVRLTPTPDTSISYPQPIEQPPPEYSELPISRTTTPAAVRRRPVPSPRPPALSSCCGHV
jgi:hypothetical protein